MVIRLKRLPIIFWLITFLFFIHAPVQGYVLQGLHILDLMIEQLGQTQSLYVTQGVIFYRPASQNDAETSEIMDAPPQSTEPTETDLPEDRIAELGHNVAAQGTLELEETLSYLFSTAFRSDARSRDSERIHVVSGDRSLTIVDGNIAPAAANRFDLYKDILLYRTREELADRLLELGVDVSVSSLGRFEGEINFVLGAVYPDDSVSQIWIDRETFLPIRWVMRGGSIGSASDVLEVHYLAWWKSGQSRYPSRIEFYQDGELVRVNQVKDFREGDMFSDDLFDIDLLRLSYPQTPEQPLIPGEPDEPSEVQKTIEEFRRVFE